MGFSTYVTSRFQVPLALAQMERPGDGGKDRVPSMYYS